MKPSSSLPRIRQVMNEFSGGPALGTATQAKHNGRGRAWPALGDLAQHDYPAMLKNLSAVSDAPTAELKARIHSIV